MNTWLIWTIQDMPSHGYWEDLSQIFARYPGHISAGRISTHKTYLVAIFMLWLQYDASITCKNLEFRFSSFQSSLESFDKCCSFNWTILGWFIWKLFLVQQLSTKMFYYMAICYIYNCCNLEVFLQINIWSVQSSA